MPRALLCVSMARTQPLNVCFLGLIMVHGLTHGTQLKTTYVRVAHQAEQQHHTHNKHQLRALDLKH